MKVKLLCSEAVGRVAAELLKSRGFEIDDHSLYSFIERGLPVPDEGVHILFDGKNLSDLLDFLDGFLKNRDLIKEMDVIIGRKKGNYQPLEVKSLYYFQADGNTIYCYTESDKFEIQKKLYEIEEDLSRQGFTRINKSVIINIMLVSEIIPWFGGRLLLKLKKKSEELEVSRNYVKSFKEFLGL